MFRVAQLRQWFSTPIKSDRSTGKLDYMTQDLLEQRRANRMAVRSKMQADVPAELHTKSFYDSIVNITLYMRQDCWKSQYIFHMLNYHQLGFRRISDLVFLDRASYFLNLRKTRDSQRWPAIKVVIALDPKIILSGIDPICQFFQYNQYFTQELSPDRAELQSIQDFINSSIVPSLESLFWHPMLTYQYTFHTNISSYQDTTKSNAIFGIIGRNGAEVVSRVASNLVSIIKEKERYASSKENLKKGLEELASACISKQGFFGGDKPSRLDFYLLAQLKTRCGSQLFLRFLQRDVGGDFWAWWIRMSNICQYNPERLTTL